MSARPKSRRACILGVFTGVYRQCKEGIYRKGRVVVKIRCGRWDCPHCSLKKAKRIYKRAFGGEIAAIAAKAGFRDYNLKLLTLTYGGKGRRAQSTPEQAAKEMQEGWAKLRKELAHLYGSFHFLKVFETHEDGWPHLHVILAGSAIAPMEVLADITRLWRFRYGFGFVKLNWASTPKKALKYVLKYLFKCPQQIPKVRLFSNSEGALTSPPQKEEREWEWTRELWVESGRTYRECAELLDGLGDQECLIEVEVLPVQGCPF